MKPNQLKILASLALPLALSLAGCGTVTGTVSDVGLAGLGGVAGYKLSDGKIGGAGIGAATGFIASKIARSQIATALAEAEKRGYERALNQAVKQQYWIIQNQQRTPEAPATRLVPVQIPAQTVDGVLTNPTTEYLRVTP